MHRHFAYELSLESNFPIPQFPGPRGNGTDVDVIVRLEDNGFQHPTITDGRRRRHIDIRTDEAVFSVQKVGTFRIRAGREIIINRVNEMDERIIQLYVIGTMMGILLYQRKLFVLHASAVRINDMAVAFLGPPGAGKSSIAAALGARGHQVIADDVTAVNWSQGRPMVTPAFPQLKLDPNDAILLGYDDDRLSELHPLESKYACGVADRFLEGTCALDHVFILVPPREEQQPDKPQNVFLEFLRQSFPTRWGQGGDARHLQQCARLINTARVSYLKRDGSSQNLKEWVRQVEACAEKHKLSIMEGRSNKNGNRSSWTEETVLVT